MISNTKFIFLFIFILSIGLNAQTVKWSQQIVDSKKVPYMLILGENTSENFFVLRSNISLGNEKENSGFRNRTYFLQYYSHEMSLLWDKELKTSYEDGHISDVTLINGNVYVTSYITDKKSKQYYFYTQIIGSDAKWQGQPLLLDSFATEYIDDENKPGLLSSRDQSLMVFSYRMISKDKKSQYFRAVLLDTNLIIKYKKEIEIPVSTQLFQPLDFLLTNQGSFFILGIRYTTEKKIKAPDQSFYELYGYNQVVDKIVNTTIKSDNKFLTDVGVVVDNLNHSIVVAGFYSDKTLYSTAGVFYYALTEDSLHETRTINTPFNTEYLQKFVGERKENKELVNFTIKRLIVRRDGGVAIVAESIYQTARSYFDYYMQTYISHYYYHYGNIMVLSVNPDGQILWNNVISKDQNSIDDGGFFSGFHLSITDGKLVSVYNKYIDDNSSVLISFVDPSGKQKTDVLFNEVERVSVITQSAKQIDDDTVLMPAYRQNKLYIGKISF